jgi:hypothetical protein
MIRPFAAGEGPRRLWIHHRRRVAAAAYEDVYEDVRERRSAWASRDVACPTKWPDIERAMVAGGEAVGHGET